MKTAVIIPSRMDANIRRCIEMVRVNEPDLEIVIVDDGLTSDWSLAHDVQPCVTVVGHKPFIFARNVNLGIREAQARGCTGFVLLNDDALLETPGGFTLLAKAIEENPEYGLIAATTNVTGQAEQWRLPETHPRYGLREVLGNIPFIAVYIPQSTVDRVGLLDERYCLDYGCEDNDYNEAVRRAGLKTGVHDGCFVDHGSLISTFRGSPDTPKSFEQNLALYKAKRDYCDRTGEPFVAGAGWDYVENISRQIPPQDGYRRSELTGEQLLRSAGQWFWKHADGHLEPCGNLGAAAGRIQGGTISSPLTVSE